MSKIVKQVAGIDVAQQELVVSFGQLDEPLSIGAFSTRVFANSTKGFKELLEWSGQLAAAHVPVRYVMEATGVYPEALGQYLFDQGREVSIVMPNKIRHFFQTLDVQTVTDKTASQAIARFGLERKLDTWKKPALGFALLRKLTRERDQIIAERTVLKNQLPAEKTAALSSQKSIARLQSRIQLLLDPEKEIKAEITALIRGEATWAGQVALLCSITGVGLITAVVVLGETNGFELIRHKKQLVSYAGLDVREKQSGTSVKGKPRISKGGNRHLPKALHFPALTAVTHDPRFNALFERTLTRHGIKMKSAGAVQRKLLEMIYTIYKQQKPYDKYHGQTITEVAVQPKAA
jgi:transposase